VDETNETFKQSGQSLASVNRSLYKMTNWFMATLQSNVLRMDFSTRSVIPVTAV